MVWEFFLNPRDLSTGKPEHGTEEAMVVTNIGTTIGLCLCREQLLDANIAPGLIPQGLKVVDLSLQRVRSLESDDLLRLRELR